MPNTRNLTIPFNLSLEDKPPAGESDLSKKISQIIEQEGHFRDLSESSLVAGDSDNDERDSQDDGLPSHDVANLAPEERIEKLWSSKDVMVQHWRRGVDEVLTTLDFLSLLISKQSPAAATGMSESLKGAKVPPGSFEPRTVKSSQQLQSKSEQSRYVSRGWRAQGFESAFKKLSAASGRLKQEAERESQFWAQTAHLKDTGWKVSRHPKSSKSIGLHFGMAESAPRYRNRGFAVLRQADNGSLFLDRGASAEHHKRLIITIEHEGHPISSSRVTSPHVIEETEVSHLAVEARDVLLDAELFHEMSREARLIANQHVKARTNSISFTVDQRFRIVLSYEDPSSSPMAFGEHDGMATYVRLSLKYLLLAAHDNSLQHRSHIPAALSTQAKATAELAILRPLITNLRHQATMKDLLRLISPSILEPSQKAAVHVKLDQKPLIETPFENLPGRRAPHLSTDSVCTAFDLVLPNGKHAEIQIVSSMGPPIYGTRCDVAETAFGFAQIAEKTYTDISSVTDAIRRLTILALVDLVQSSKTPSGEWEVTMPLKGELSYFPATTTKETLKIRIQMQSQNLILRVIPASKHYDSGKKVLAWSWNAAGAFVTGDSSDVSIPSEQAKGLSFMDVITKLGEV